MPDARHVQAREGRCSRCGAAMFWSDAAVPAVPYGWRHAGTAAPPCPESVVVTPRLLAAAEAGAFDYRREAAPTT